MLFLRPTITNIQSFKQVQHWIITQVFSIFVLVAYNSFLTINVLSRQKLYACAKLSHICKRNDQVSLKIKNVFCFGGKGILFGPKLIKAASQPLMKFYWIYTIGHHSISGIGRKSHLSYFSKFHVEVSVGKKSGVGVLEVPFSESESLLWSRTKAA